VLDPCRHQFAWDRPKQFCLGQPGRTPRLVTSWRLKTPTSATSDRAAWRSARLVRGHSLRRYRGGDRDIIGACLGASLSSDAACSLSQACECAGWEADGELWERTVERPSDAVSRETAKPRRNFFAALAADFPRRLGASARMSARGRRRWDPGCLPCPHGARARRGPDAVARLGSGGPRFPNNAGIANTMLLGVVGESQHGPTLRRPDNEKTSIQPQREIKRRNRRRRAQGQTSSS
jgi:hypothetical protein